MKFELHIHRKARKFVSELDAEDWAHFKRVVDNLCLDSWIDNITKFSLPMPPAMFLLYQDDLFRIAHRVVDNYVVDVFKVDFAPEI